MALFIFYFIGGIVGGFVVLLWASIDAVFGLGTLTEVRALGVAGMGIVAGNAIGWGMIVYGEFQ